MLHPAIPAPRAAVAGLAQRSRAWLKRAWAAVRDGDDGRLGEARDHAELERRLRRLERGRVDRFGPLPPTP